MPFFGTIAGLTITSPAPRFHYFSLAKNDTAVRSNFRCVEFYEKRSCLHFSTPAQATRLHLQAGIQDEPCILITHVKIRLQVNYVIQANDCLTTVW